MNSLCQTCRKMLYRTDACKGDGFKACGRTDGGSKVSAKADVAGTRMPERTAPKSLSRKSTAELMEVPKRSERSGEAVPRGKRRNPQGHPLGADPAGTQAPPVDTPKPKHKDRHKPGYQAEKQRQYRANKKAKEAAK